MATEAVGQYIQALRGGKRELHIGEAVIPLTKDRVSGNWGYFDSALGKFVEVDQSIMHLYQQPGAAAPGGYSWQDRKDIGG